MMGMTNVSFYASWIVTYLIIYTLICVANAILLTSGFFTHSNGFFIFFYLWFFCIVLIFQSLFVRCLSLPKVFKTLQKRVFHEGEVRDHRRDRLLLHPLYHQLHRHRERSLLRGQAKGLALKPRRHGLRLRDFAASGSYSSFVSFPFPFLILLQDQRGRDQQGHDARHGLELQAGDLLRLRADQHHHLLDPFDLPRPGLPERVRAEEAPAFLHPLALAQEIAISCCSKRGLPSAHGHRGCVSPLLL